MQPTKTEDAFALILRPRDTISPRFLSLSPTLSSERAELKISRGMRQGDDKAGDRWIDDGQGRQKTWNFGLIFVNCEEGGREKEREGWTLVADFIHRTGIPLVGIISYRLRVVIGVYVS